MAAPPLSVVVCTHTRPDYLRVCLAGLAAQTRLDFEILVVDSASPPAAAARIAELAAVHGAKVLRAERPGLSQARNLGLSSVRAPWVAYLDDDAVPEPGWAEALLARIAVLPASAAALGGRIMPAWEAPLPVWWPPSLRGVLTIVEWEGFGEPGRDLPPEVDIYGANMAFATRALRAVGGFPVALGRMGKRLLSGEEVEVVSRLRTRGHTVFYDGAVAVRHSIQRERLRPGWLLKRLLWQGATDALRDRRRGQAGRHRAFSAALRLLVQAPLLLWPSGSPALLRARCGAAYNLGYLRGRLSWDPAGAGP